MVQELHHRTGNRAVGALVGRHALGLQAKLAINEPGDAYEQEADRVADRVMRMAIPTAVQRESAMCDQGDGRLQRRPADIGGSSMHAAPPIVDQVINSGGGHPLESSTRSFFEPRFGYDFGRVRVHTGGRAAESARAVDALAYTVGTHIVFGAGEYAPDTFAGSRLLAHELTHAIQQGSSSAPRLQRAVRFQADFSNVKLIKGKKATIAGATFNYEHANFSADADITAIGDSVAELREWDVGILQDRQVGWERYYWQRDNKDKQGNFVEKKFKFVNVKYRDQARAATTVWDADSEHQLLSGVGAGPAGGKFKAVTRVPTSDTPGGPETTDGSAVPGMNASDGARNISTLRAGRRFETWISAHNTASNTWRHLRRLNWNFQHSLDFTGSGASLKVGAEQWELGRYGPLAAGKEAPLLSGTTANTAMNDDAFWSLKRVNGWT